MYFCYGKVIKFILVLSSHSILLLCCLLFLRLLFISVRSTDYRVCSESGEVLYTTASSDLHQLPYIPMYLGIKY